MIAKARRTIAERARRFRPRRGSWRPGNLPIWVPFAVQLYLLEPVLVRGVDYALGDSPEVSQSLGYIEADLPLIVWGLVFLSAVALFGIGVGGRWAMYIVAAHVIAGAAYVGVGYGLLEVAVERDFDGVRTANGLLAAGILHLIFAAGTASTAQQARIRRERGRPIGAR